VTGVDSVLLAGVRADIDRIDREIVALLAGRHRLVLAAGRLKGRASAVPAPERQADVLAGVRRHADEHGLPPEVVEAVYRAMIDAFVRLETESLAESRPPSELRPRPEDRRPQKTP
jgi:chorismate mutase-like protein